jgi:hypothetical protein
MATMNQNMMAKSRQSVDNPWAHSAGLLIIGKDLTDQWQIKNYG